ncbi:Mitochondrial zinc maintenance protein 1, mitochondrial [Neurospora sp. IMI 360204]|uniref:Mitochondrial zinc maintenance protein 1, mitochondrial n=1 Tax=Neurospora tetraspora TaxID=94610 RepID=A0AAE0JP79_9PEZI|nr:Mitochondrial zinc maintenance protein 1, mitochondrial [Neurospora sp. IMI 360204]KAK3355199.1 hypothetical protein B0H65DRAFT_438465 [Neurospora tetraspora]
MSALQAYRHLMRAARVAFDGDARTLTAAYESISRGFRENQNLPANDPTIAPAIAHAEEVASFLRSNVVQGRKEGESYKLRIHQDTERGDNDTIKLGNQSIKIGEEHKCCSA